MRRLPGPACCRLSEGDHTPEALYELFRDWQRIQTQSSSITRRRPPTDSDRTTTGKVRFARHSPRTQTVGVFTLEWLDE